MGQPGVGAMIHYLSGGTRHSASEFYGRRIVSAALDSGESPNGIRLSFDDGTVIRIWDDGQSCCESRYTTTDDDLSKIIGGVLRRIETKEAPNVADEYGDHEQVFVEIGTDECFVTLVTHNQHNGYYGGFGLTIDVDTAPGAP
jgi:hypothetical protein